MTQYGEMSKMDIFELLIPKRKETVIIFTTSMSLSVNSGEVGFGGVENIRIQQQGGLPPYGDPTPRKEA